jgi:hypothetical protein
MALETSRRRPLNVVLAPGSPAEAAYTSAILAPGFQPEPSLDLVYFGGKTIPHLTYACAYLGSWDDGERRSLDETLAAAMTDPYLNNVIAQYFPESQVEARFAGSTVHPGAPPERVYADTVESLVAELARTSPFDALDPASSVLCVLLPKGTVLVDGPSTQEDGVDSLHGLAGYHGSMHAGASTVYYAVSAYSEGQNGIPAFRHPWENVCATLYHELQEVRTDPDVEDAIRAGSGGDASQHLGWYSPRGGEIGDIPMSETLGEVRLVMRRVPLADGRRRVPIQLLWSNAVGGPEGPIARPYTAPTITRPPM